VGFVIFGHQRWTDIIDAARRGEPVGSPPTYR
jgi:hypothetical protein